jgi:hypothetical protein
VRTYTSGPWGRPAGVGCTPVTRLVADEANATTEAVRAERARTLDQAPCDDRAVPERDPSVISRCGARG